MGVNDVEWTILSGPRRRRRLLFTTKVSIVESLARG